MADPNKRHPQIEPISVRIPEAVRLTGLSRSRLYELMKSREIEVVKVGTSTLIPYESLRAFIEGRRRGEVERA
jgi:excisionase family DNA binding protein